MNRVIISSGNEHDSIINQDTNDWCNDAVVNTLKPAFWGTIRRSFFKSPSGFIDFFKFLIWVEGLLHASFC
ncbi:unnamed protein product [Lactuca virosa]|uniref:Uncharacterized protein n=1 Tax=Lactuca virosa TaxID=75947 RepID=A0AAU9ME63_9ASTR|nr:unnamed protein product [Lactuca virosa]